MEYWTEASWAMGMTPPPGDAVVVFMFRIDVELGIAEVVCVPAVVNVDVTALVVCVSRLELVDIAVDDMFWLVAELERPRK